MKKYLYSFGIIVIILAVIGIYRLVYYENPPYFLYQKNASLYDEIVSIKPPQYPNITFATLSDIHIYDKNLGNSGEAFQAYLDSDRKMLLESEHILKAAIDDIIVKKPSFVLISGDLTKDGEILSHHIVVKHLKRLQDSNIHVYVVPGNHDINNSDAKRFNGNYTTPVPSANKEDFTSMYHDFGYQEAISKDTDSLSYIIEPIDGLWIFALDTNRYRENVATKPPIVGGKLYDTTLEWLENQLIIANKQGKAILAFFHHGVLQHYDKNEEFYPEYLLQHYKHIGEMLAFYNVRLAFTGHFHANDISFFRFQHGKFIYDVETGSLVSAPSPYRFITLQDNRADISTFHVTNISRHENFAAFARDYTKNGFETLAKNIMESYWVSKEDQEYIAPFISKAFIAHYYGDEIVPQDEILPDSSKLGLFGKIVLSLKKDLIISIWNDINPADNNVVLDVENGL